ncbi:hypothetical protein RUND412_008976 [Rhizina undulata]
MGKSGKPKKDSSSSTAGIDTVRLHIAPLTPETTSALIPPTILDDATKKTISYHTIPTFPEKSYGFLNVSVEKAEKLKKKLNGLTFRGVKVRVDEARPETWKEKIEAPEEKQKEKKKRKREGEGEEEKKKKKKGKEEGVYEGYQLPEGRKVQRGWTKEKGKEAGRRECLFKTTMPPIPPVEEKGKKNEKERGKEKEDEKGMKRKGGKLVKEFEKSTKFPQFLKTSQLDPNRGKEDMVSKYVEGVGWVDGKGSIKEKVKPKKKEAMQVQKKVDVQVEEEKEAEKEEKIDAMDVDEEDASEGESSGEDEEEGIVTSKKPEPAKNIAPAETSDASDSGSSSGSKGEDIVASKNSKSVKAETSDASDSSPSSEEEDNSNSSGSDSEYEEEEEEEEAGQKKEVQAQNPEPEPKKSILKNSPQMILPLAAESAESASDSDASDSSSESESESEKEPVNPKTPTKPTTKAKAKTPPSLQVTIPPIHPLEALYKPTAASPSANPSTFKFSFTSANADSDSDSDSPPTVQTPYKDPARYRSSAPTPDTAIGTRRFFSPDSDSPSGDNRGFVPSTLKLPRAGFTTSLATEGAVKEAGKEEAPLLFPHSESRFLGALSMWGRLPTPKTFEETVEEKEEGEEEGEKKKKKVKAEDAEDGKDVRGGKRVKAWRERFYASRGDWNREWKKRRREVLKSRKKKEVGARKA